MKAVADNVRPTYSSGLFEQVLSNTFPQTPLENAFSADGAIDEVPQGADSQGGLSRDTAGFLLDPRNIDFVRRGANAVPRAPSDTLSRIQRDISRAWVNTKKSAHHIASSLAHLATYDPFLYYPAKWLADRDTDSELSSWLLDEGLSVEMTPADARAAIRRNSALAAVEYGEQFARIPHDAGVRNFLLDMQKNGFFGAVKANPSSSGRYMASQVLSSVLPAVGAFLVTTGATKNPLAGAFAFAGMGFGIEASSAYDRELGKPGVLDDASLRRGFLTAQRRAAVIAGVETLGAVGGAKLLTKAAASPARRRSLLIATGEAAGLNAVSAGSGEALGQLVTDGKVYSTDEVLLETVASFLFDAVVSGSMALAPGNKGFSVGSRIKPGSVEVNRLDQQNDYLRQIVARVQDLGVPTKGLRYVADFVRITGEFQETDAVFVPLESWAVFVEEARSRGAEVEDLLPSLTVEDGDFYAKLGGSRIPIPFFEFVALVGANPEYRSLLDGATLALPYIPPTLPLHTPAVVKDVKKDSSDDLENDLGETSEDIYTALSGGEPEADVDARADGSPLIPDDPEYPVFDRAEERRGDAAAKVVVHGSRLGKIRQHVYSGLLRSHSLNPHVAQKVAGFLAPFYDDVMQESAGEKEWTFKEFIKKFPLKGRSLNTPEVSLSQVLDTDNPSKLAVRVRQLAALDEVSLSDLTQERVDLYAAEAFWIPPNILERVELFGRWRSREPFSQPISVQLQFLARVFYLAYQGAATAIPRRAMVWGDLDSWFRKNISGVVALSESPGSGMVLADSVRSYLDTPLAERSDGAVAEALANYFFSAFEDYISGSRGLSENALPAMQEFVGFLTQAAPEAGLLHDGRGVEADLMKLVLAGETSAGAQSQALDALPMFTDASQMPSDSKDGGFLNYSRAYARAISHVHRRAMQMAVSPVVNALRITSSAWGLAREAVAKLRATQPSVVMVESFINAPSKEKISTQDVLDVGGPGMIYLFGEGGLNVLSPDGVSLKSAMARFGFRDADAFFNEFKNYSPLDRDTWMGVLSNMLLNEQVGDPLSWGQSAFTHDAWIDFLFEELSYLNAIIRDPDGDIPSRVDIQIGVERAFSRLPLRRAVMSDFYRDAVRKASLEARDLAQAGDYIGARQAKIVQLRAILQLKKSEAVANQVAQIRRMAGEIDALLVEKNPSRDPQISGITLRDVISFFVSKMDLSSTPLQYTERDKGRLYVFAENHLFGSLAGVGDFLKRRNIGSSFLGVAAGEVDDLFRAVAGALHQLKNEDSYTFTDSKVSKSETEQQLSGDLVAISSSEESRKWNTGARQLLAQAGVSLFTLDTLLARLGPAFIKLIGDPIKKARDRHTAYWNNEVLPYFENLVSGFPSADLKMMGKKRVYSNLGGRSFTRWQLIAMALNLGSAGNATRLASDPTQGLASRYHQELLDSLTHTEMQFVQGVWDYFRELWPTVNALVQRQFGYKAAYVKPRPLEVNGTRYAGGYYPIFYDPAFLTDADLSPVALDNLADRLLNFENSTMMVRGFKETHRSRGEPRPLELSISPLFTYISRLTTELYLSEAVANSFSALRRPGVVQLFSDKGLGVTKNAVEVALRDTFGRSGALNNPLDRVSEYLRRNLTFLNMAWRPAAVAIQPLGMLNSVTALGAPAMTRAVFAMATNPVRVTRLVFQLSLNMQNMINSGAVGAPFDNLETSTFGNTNLTFKRPSGVATLTAMGWSALKYVQFYGVNVPTWYASYTKDVQNGVDMDAAVHNADRAVTATQSGGSYGQLPQISRGVIGSRLPSNWVRLATLLGGYMIATANVIYLSSRGKTKFETAFRISRALLVSIVIPAVLYGLVRGRPPEDSDEDGEIGVGEVASWAGTESVYTFLGSFPFLRDLASAMQGFPAGGAAGGAAVNIKRGVDSALDIMQGDGDWKDGGKFAMGIATVLPHIPGRMFYDISKFMDATDGGWDMELSDVIKLFLGRPYD